MGLFGGKKKAAPPASTATAPPASTSPIEAMRQTLGQLSQATESMDASVPALLEQLAQQLSQVGSVMHEPCLTAFREAKGVETLTATLKDACLPEPRALAEARDGAAQVEEERVGYKCAVLSGLASVAYIGGVAELQQQGDALALLVTLIAHENETVRSYAGACLQNVTSLVEQVDLEVMAPLLPQLEQLGPPRPSPTTTRTSRAGARTARRSTSSGATQSRTRRTPRRQRRLWARQRQRLQRHQLGGRQSDAPSPSVSRTARAPRQYMQTGLPVCCTNCTKGGRARACACAAATQATCSMHARRRSHQQRTASSGQRSSGELGVNSGGAAIDGRQRHAATQQGLD